MPFLSDIDLVVVTDTVQDKERVEARLGKIRHLIPMLEPQSPVVTLAEFHGWMEQGRFAENRSFLYRILEARETWEMLYSRDNDNPLKSTRKLERNEIIAVIFSEILFWHRIVITEYTRYHLGDSRPPGYVESKRFCWIFMKATTELYNFLQALQEQRAPIFTRRQIIKAAIEGSVDRRWVKLFKYNLMIIDNQFDPGQSNDYLDDSMSCLSFLYGELHKQMASMLDENVEFIDWLQNNRHKTTGISVPEYHAVDLDNLPVIRLQDDETATAVYITPQLRSNSRHKVLVIFVLQSLKIDSLESVERGMDVITEFLAPRGVKRDQIEIELVDRYGFGCFGIARKAGPEGLLALSEDSSDYLRTLYDRIFIAGAATESSQAENSEQRCQ
jgi:hypothetical protein